MVKLWIHEKQYNLENFEHPGGVYALTIPYETDDATAYFEANHTNTASKLRSLSTFLCHSDNDAATVVRRENNFTFRGNGKYADLKRQVMKKLGYKTTANWIFWVKAIFLCYLHYYTMTKVGFWFGFLSGISLMSIIFVIMHDASHLAVIHSDKWYGRDFNKYISMFWNAYVLWNSHIWSRHHTLKHHSNTGELNDPDTDHGNPFYAKLPVPSRKPCSYITSSPYWIFFVTICCPGMYLGQVLSYLRCLLYKNRVFRVSYAINFCDRDQVIELILYCFSLLGHLFMTYYQPWFMIGHILGMNLTYALNIMADHDTYESGILNNTQQNEAEWAEMQIRRSANWYPADRSWLGLLWTHCFGGINYQIEHHLFPHLCHVHYPTIAPLVRKWCQEHNVPYSSHANITDALGSVFQHYQHLQAHFTQSSILPDAAKNSCTIGMEK